MSKCIRKGFEIKSSIHPHIDKYSHQHNHIYIVSSEIRDEFRAESAQICYMSDRQSWVDSSWAIRI